jgi:hypothetical protein
MQAKWILPLFRLSHPLQMIRLPKIPTIRPIHIHQLLPDPLHHQTIQANRGRRAIHRATPNQAVKTRLLSVV